MATSTVRIQEMPSARSDAESTIDRRTVEVLESMAACLPDDLERFRSACAPVDDWTGLLILADRHGLQAVVYSAMREAGVGLPPEIVAAMDREMAFARLRQAHLDAALDDALRALERAQIRVCVLKGPFLGERLYPDRSLRHSVDLDLLVAPDDVASTIAALAEVGFVAEDNPTERYHRIHHHHISVYHASEITIEVHFRAHSGFGTSLDAADLLARAAPYRSRSGVAALILSPEDELLYLIVHAAGHGFSRLGWLYDIKLFMRHHPHLDWRLVASRARSYGVASVLSFALDRRWLGIDGPDPRSLGLTQLGRVRSRAALWLLDSLGRVPAATPAQTTFKLLYSAALCDRVPAAAGALRRHGGRILRRRMHRYLPGLVPDEWSA